VVAVKVRIRTVRFAANSRVATKPRQRRKASLRSSTGGRVERARGRLTSEGT
jgi:hypothetical protein